MPRTPRNSPNPTGRPPKAAEASAAEVLASRTGMPKGEAARKVGVSPSTARRHAAAKRQAGKVAAPPASPAPVQATASPLDRLRVYAAHDPGALAALEALVSDDEGIGRDELADLREGLRLAADVVRTAAAKRVGDGEDDGPLLRALQRLEGLGKTVATVKAKRPPSDGPDEATRRILAVRERAIERIGILTSEAAAKLSADRESLGTWARGALGDLGAAELLRRIDAMLGGAPS